MPARFAARIGRVSGYDRSTPVATLPSDGFWDGVPGVLKALVWPAFLVYDPVSFSP